MITFEKDIPPKTEKIIGNKVSIKHIEVRTHADIEGETETITDKYIALIGGEVIDLTEKQYGDILNIIKCAVVNKGIYKNIEVTSDVSK